VANTGRSNYVEKATLDISKHRLTDLKAFDSYLQREIVRASMHINLLYKEDTDAEETRDPSVEEQYDLNNPNLVLEANLNALGEILNGPRNVRADLEATLQDLSEYYQPKLEELVSTFSKIGERYSAVEPTVLDSLRVSGELVAFGRDLIRHIKWQLGKQPEAEEPDEHCSDVNLLITKALDFMILVDDVCHSSKTTMDGLLNNYGVHI